ncbi:MAG: nucleotidyltransferase domain-containing protein [Deltaproteobacteria bacterium]|nr:nucleotidyltransferase domain-containing protein [Deltaproteobacteria bacterium]
MSQQEILSVLSDYKKTCAEKYGILELGVFGSVARNEATALSDVDICIKMKTPDAFALVHIKEDIEKLMQKHVDIVRIREKMNPFLKNKLEKEALYV